MKDSFTVRDLPISERPRERLLKLGSEALSAQEILAIILGRGTKGEPVMMISQKLLNRFGNLKSIANASLEELTETKGVGPAKAAQIKAALELSKRLEADAGEGPRPILKSPEDVTAVVRSQLKGKKREHFLVLCLDTRNRLIDCRPVSIGSLNTSIVHPREVFAEAVSCRAASVIFAHNHPSGDPEPSKEDVELTKRLVKAGEIMGIDVLDHIIVCDKSHVSLKARDLF
jgi:DNA repair protein RadC